MEERSNEQMELEGKTQKIHHSDRSRYFSKLFLSSKISYHFDYLNQASVDLIKMRLNFNHT